MMLFALLGRLDFCDSRGSFFLLNFFKNDPEIGDEVFYL
jgi:hypothetical protein